jgi:hypothetical protein
MSYGVSSSLPVFIAFYFRRPALIAIRLIILILNFYF